MKQDSSSSLTVKSIDLQSTISSTHILPFKITRALSMLDIHKYLEHCLPMNLYLIYELLNYCIAIPLIQLIPL